MRRALGLARRAWGRTSPNPMVGAVVVKDSVEVGAGHHEFAGAPHAEVNALADAGTDAQGATLYVTLEPCCTTGRTPPCTDAVIGAGIARVVVGCLDANPAHAGRGIDVLKAAGIATTVGVAESACRSLNESFFHWIRYKRPFVILKMGMTLDGKIATASGQSKWITGPAARRRVQRLRQWADAIMVGGETARSDDPRLTVRSPKNWPRQPRKIVWTTVPPSDFSPELRIFADPANNPLFAAPRTSGEWMCFLADLGAQDITALLIEGGGELAANCLRAGAVDKLVFFVAPKILGGRGSRSVVAGNDPLSLDDALGLADVKVERVGSDLMITGYPPCSQD